MGHIKKLQQKVFITGEIKLLTGLHIGGTNTQMGIGGPDKLVIRNPLTQMPIIPGSSLKGKMRGLLELLLGKYEINNPKKFGEVGNDPDITKLFGSSADKNNPNTNPSRLIVRDAELNPDKKTGGDWNNTDMYYSESKTEVSINRLTSKANPRTFERIPAGAVFDFEMIVNIVSEDNKIKDTREDLIKLLVWGMELLEKDYLGGQGSRGYGQIKFENLKLEIINLHGDDKHDSDGVESLKPIFEKRGFDINNFTDGK